MIWLNSIQSDLLSRHWKFLIISNSEIKFQISRWSHRFPRITWSSKQVIKSGKIWRTIFVTKLQFMNVLQQMKLSRGFMVSFRICLINSYFCDPATIFKKLQEMIRAVTIHQFQQRLQQYNHFWPTVQYKPRFKKKKTQNN